MKRLSTFLVLAIAILAANAKDADSSSSSPYYLFLSGKISAEVKEAYYPLKAFDGKKLRLDGSNKAIRPTKKLSCSMKPMVVISTLYADIRDFEYSVDSNTEKIRTMMAINEMNAEQMRFEAGAEFATAKDFMGNQRPPVTEGDIATAALTELTKNQTDNEYQKSGMNNWIDMVYGRCSIVSNRDLENAYAAVVLSFDESVGKNGKETNRVTFVRFAPIGDMDADIEKTLKLNFEFPEIKALSSKIEIFLFDGKGRHVATNLSRGLEQLSSEQVQEYRDLQKQGKK